ncbi:MAG: type II toxin-antitoxin system HicB family antitoxin [Deltaproteobacteria bacterium]|nr:type II toxin-antitoxin system HicB family antitoxin [Deltaproteobacteria bacterium]
MRGTPSQPARARTLRYVYWRDGEFWLGFLEEFPDYMTQGESRTDLQEHLRDLYQELTSGHIPAVRRVSELQVA